MDCETWLQETESWLFADDEPDFSRFPKHLSDHTAECARCARRFAALRQTYATQASRVPAPEGLSQRIMERVETEREQPGTRFVGRSLALAASALLVIGVALSVMFVMLRQDSQTVTVQLELEAPRAETVSVVGDWNQWDPDADVMKDADNDGVWELRLKLESDQVYQYQFIIDDEEWVPDPRAPVKVDDGFGGTNSVLDV